MLSDFYHEKENGKIWSVYEYDIDEEDGTIGPRKGPFLFSFDKKKIYDYWRDYPDNMTAEEVELFDKEFPEWAGGYYHHEYRGKLTTEEDAELLDILGE